MSETDSRETLATVITTAAITVAIGVTVAGLFGYGSSGAEATAEGSVGVRPTAELASAPEVAMSEEATANEVLSWRGGDDDDDREGRARRHEHRRHRRGHERERGDHDE
ncbi:MAG: hypothetical protein U0353_14990 [Sandaracinus sp.]